MNISGNLALAKMFAQLTKHMKKIFLFLLLTTPFLLFAQGDWKLEKDKRGIKVFTKKIDGRNLKRSKTTTTISASIDEVFAWLTNVERHKEWMDKVSTSEVLENVSNTEFIAYYVANAPWPASDRDIVVHYTIDASSATQKIIQVREESNYLPEKDGFVRVPMTNSTWTITDNGDGTVSVVYETVSEPGGSVPDWMANSAAVDSPFNTVTGLKEGVEAN